MAETMLLPHHAALLQASTVSDEIVRERGYRSIERVEDLLALGFAEYQCRVPGLLTPVYDVFGVNGQYSYRPDEPRIAKGKPVKYETPEGSRLVVDVPDRMKPFIGDVRIPLWITESPRKADALLSHGFPAIAVTGVWGWRGRNDFGGLAALGDWEGIAFRGKDAEGRTIRRKVTLCFDSDQAVNPQVHGAVQRCAAFVRTRGANVRFACIPHPTEGKLGIDDYFGLGHTAADIKATIVEELPPLPGPPEPPDPLTEIITAYDLSQKVFAEPRWAIPGFIAEGATLLVGGPKIGKSWMLLGWGLSIAYGGKAMGQIDVEQGDVLLLCLEDSQPRLLRRLQMMVGHDLLPNTLHLMTWWPRLDEGGAEKLYEWTQNYPNARLIGIDVLLRIRPPRAVNADSYSADYNLMAAIKQVADASGVPIVPLHHDRKMTADDPFDTVSGTKGLTAAADATLILNRSRGTGDANLYMRGRDVEESDTALKFDPVQGLWSVIGDANIVDLPEARLEVVNYMRDRGPVTPGDIAEALGKNPSTTRGVVMRMFRDGQLLAKDGRYFLPDTPSTGSTGSTPDDGSGQMNVPWEV
jgi:hypothetical protein